MTQKKTDTTKKSAATIKVIEPSFEEQQPKGDKRLSFPVVAIGASAGGLEALKLFFEAMPPDSGIAFVVIQHLDPDKHSLMAEILSRSTRMTVSQADHDEKIEPNHIYVVPPGKKLIMQNSQLILGDLSKDKLLSSHAFDEFLRSMAAEQGDSSICIILSGTGSDGSLGLQAIKAAGGFCMVQEPMEAGYSGMPISAINTGLADYVLPARSLADELLHFVRHGGYGTHDDTFPQSTENEIVIDEILGILGNKVGNNFSGYKLGTISRRIERRMHLLRLPDIKAYAEFLRQDEKEFADLAKDFLIVVTSFFRDQEAFALLQSEVIAPLCHRALPETPIRVWVAGASTGEEAYSIAILILEELERCQKETYGLQIFATDIDSEVLQQARAGIYPATIEADVSKERLSKFFERQGNGYRVKKKVRETITFSEQDLVRDPPFSKIDLISCRNLLIYFKIETQRRILSLFHFALKPEGVMFLGNAETVGRDEDLFQPIDKKWRIFQKIASLRVPLIPFSRRRHHEGFPPLLARNVELKKPINLKVLGENQLLKHFAPCGVIVNASYDILQFLGDTSLFLKIPDGSPNINLLAMVPLVMRSPLRATLQDMDAKKQLSATLLLRLPDIEGKPYRQVQINVRQIEDRHLDSKLFLIAFADLPECQPELPHVPNTKEDINEQEIIIHQLEDELIQTRDSLENTIEQMETTNEELKASNEEAMSLNEEFQATNEELETSKEELQSMNEELTTVNSELLDKLTELEETNNDLDNLLASSDVAFLFLDANFNIKRFTPAIQKLFRILPTDIGRPLDDFGTTFSKLSLLDDAKKVMQDLVAIEREIQSEDGSWYLKRVLPFRTQSNHITGVLVTFLDVTSIRKKEEEALHQANLLRVLNETLPLQVAYVDTEERHLFANKAYRELFTIKAEQVMGLKLQNVMWPPCYAAAIPFIAKAMAGESASFEKSFDLAEIGRRDISCRFSPHFDDHGQVAGFFVIMQDMTEFRLAESTRSWLSAIVDSSHDAIISRDFDGTIRSWNKGAEQMFGYSALEMLGKKIDVLFPVDQPEGFDDFDLLYRGAGEGHSVLYCRTKSDKPLVVKLTQSPILGQDGEPMAVSVILSDISASKEMERQVIETNKNLEIKVAERTLSLQQSMNQLRRMALELTQTEQRERQRLSTVLHNDLQQLLVAAGLRLERLANSENDPDKRQAIRQIETLISQSVASTRSLATDLKPPVLNNSNLVKSLHWLADWLWKRFDFTLKISVPDELRTDNIPNEDIVFLFDSARELCFNIVKHSHVKEARMTLQLTAQKRLRLTIADDGIGMDIAQDDLPTPTDGGLGLTSIRERLDLMGGELHINTAVGKGFCADIILPYTLKEVARPRLVPARKKTSKPASGSGSLPPTHKIRVLLVDDHAVVRDGLRMILQDEADIDVIGEAGDGERALKLAGKQRPDVIIMDVNMPKMNGIEATKLIKQNFPEICILALSINDDPGTNNAMLEAGACAYMSKSGSADNVCQMIRACMEGKYDSAREPAASKPEGEEKEGGA